MNSTFLLVCFAVLINTGYALKCYQCEGETLNACTRKDSPYIRIVSCGMEHPNFFRFCLMRVVNDLQLKKTNVTMGCDLIGRQAVLKIIPQCQVQDENRYELKMCNICTWDLCTFDTSARHPVSKLITVLCLLSLFVLNKLTL